jgi:hypothetical protein
MRIQEQASERFVFEATIQPMWCVARMSGRAPAGEPRKASQRNSRPAAPIIARITPTWRAGDQVRWHGRTGAFRRDVGDGEHAEVVIGERVYRVRVKELA